MSFIRKILSLFSSKEKDRSEKDKSSVCCLGCRHLFYWNDGSAGCDLEKEDICILNGFCLREPNRSCLNCKNYSMRFDWCSKLDKYIELYSDAEGCRSFDTY